MYEYKAVVRRVVDGDTIDLDIDLGFGVWKFNERIRLYGVDTPEVRGKEKQFGKFVKSKVKRLLPVSTECTVTTFKDKAGKYGRMLGVIQTEGVDLGTYLLVNRYAVPYKGQSKDQIHETHMQNWEKIKND